MQPKKFLNIHFWLIVVGQIISLFGNGILRFALPLYLLQITNSSALFGNGILRFALPLYLLQITNSSALFGMVSALSFLPLIFITPFGGIIADRYNKRNIMVLLDFLTAFLILFFTFSLNQDKIISQVLVTLMVLYGIGGLYQPAVQASIPFLLQDELLTKGNAIISSVSALSNLLSPILGGILLGIYGLTPILLISILCFLLSALLELFIQIPSINTFQEKNILQIIQSDIPTTFAFVQKEKQSLFKIIQITCILNGCISTFVLIALPVLITEKLQFSSQIYGISSAILGLGGILGGILTSFIQLPLFQLDKLCSVLTLSILPFLISLLCSNRWISLFLVTASAFCIMLIATMISILIITYLQKITPQELSGKILSLLITVSLCSQPLGQMVYGYFFHSQIGQWFSVILAFSICGFITLYTKSSAFKKAFSIQ